MKYLFSALLIAGSLISAAAPVYAQEYAQQQAQDPAASQTVAGNRILDLQASEQGDGLFVQIEFAERLTGDPVSFSVNEPARIAFDFLDTANALGHSQQDFRLGNLRSANIVQAGDRTRLVLNLDRLAPYSTRIEGRRLLVNFAPVATTSPASAVETFSRFAEPPPPALAGAARSIRDIQFRRGAEGEGKIMVELSTADTGIDIRRQGANLVVEFLETDLPESLHRRSDVTDFATPVTEFLALPQSGNSRLVITPTGQWEHNAYQADRLFVVEFRRVEQDPNKLVDGPERYSGERLSLNFQDIEVRAVLQIFSDFTDNNIVVSDSVQGRITLRLDDVPWDQALEVIMQARGLAMEKDGNVIWIATVGEFQQWRENKVRLTAITIESEALVSEVFPISYHSASEIRTLIESTSTAPAVAPVAPADPAGGLVSARLLTERGSVRADDRTNKLFVTDVASSVDRIRRFIAEIDIPPRQVMIEARIVEANTTFQRDLGMRLGAGTVMRGRSVGTDAGGNLIPQASLGGALPGGNLVNLPTFNAPSSALQMILWNSAATAFIDLELAAAEVDTRATIVSRPRVLTADQQEAEIVRGARIPYETVSSQGTQVQFEQADLKLLVRPRISPDGRIAMQVEITNDYPDESRQSGGRPLINQQKVVTEVLVENGGTVALGGVIVQRSGERTSQVPLLSEIPVFGNLFRSRSRGTGSEELMIFITPRIFDQSLGVR